MNSDNLNELYMFEYDHDWGQRGNRRNSIIYFSATEENKWDILQYHFLENNLMDIFKEEKKRGTLTKIEMGKVIKRTYAHD
jgi:hypothetical protein